MSLLCRRYDFACICFCIVSHGYTTNTSKRYDKLLNIFMSHEKYIFFFGENTGMSFLWLFVIGVSFCLAVLCLVSFLLSLFKVSPKGKTKYIFLQFEMFSEDKRINANILWRKCTVKKCYTQISWFMTLVIFKK